MSYPARVSFGKQEIVAITYEKKEGKAHTLLPEIWQLILSYINQSHANLKYVGQVARVCRFFRDVSREQVISWRLPDIFAHVKPGNEKLPDPVNFFNEQSECQDLDSLIFSRNGMYFFKSKANPAALLCLKTSLTSGAFALLSINLLDAVEQGLVEMPNDFFDPSNKKDCFSVVNCHETPDGWIIVCKSGFFVCKYDEQDVLNIEKFFSPYTKYKLGDSEIASSGYSSGCVYIQYTKEIVSGSVYSGHTFAFFDLRMTEPKAIILTVPSLICAYSKIFNSRDQLCVYNFAEVPYVGEISCKKTESTGAYSFQNKTKLNVENDSSKLDQNTFRSSDQWLTCCDSTRFFYVFNMEKKCTWLNGTAQIKYSSQHFIQQDILFVIYADSFRAFYLPANQEITDVLASYLKPYLERYTIISIVIKPNGLDKFALDILLQTKQSPFELSKVLFSLNLNEDFKKTDFVRKIFRSTTVNSFPPPVIQQQVPSVETTTPTSLAVSPPSSSRCSLNHKTALAVATVFLILSAGAFITLLVLKPGQVVFQGKGIILTVPNVAALSLMGIMGIVVLAIGSYTWWKKQRVLRSAV